MHKPIRYISIVGKSYSGSTILARWLSRLDDTIAVGEAELWFSGKRKTAQNSGEQCSCGQTMNMCPFWQSVTNRNEMEAQAEKLGYSIIIDSGKKYSVPNSYVICIYKNFWQRRKSFKNHQAQLPSRRMRYAPAWLNALIYSKKHPDHIHVDQYISYTEFCMDPENILQEVAQKFTTTISEQEHSHIALSNRSKYKPLQIKRS